MKYIRGNVALISL